ncbi:MAG TPA: MMPL family transporter, partial [Chloroflexota bacterium]|nr:MMPL family transporter [Chloroflexota bacterium]
MDSLAPSFGRTVYRLRWAVIVTWLIIFGCAAVFAPRVTSVLKGGGYSTPTSQSGRAYNAIGRLYGGHALAFTAVFRPDRQVPRAALLSDMRGFQERVRHHIRSLQPGPLRFSPDGRLGFVRLFTAPRQDLAIPLTRNVRALLQNHRGIRAYLTGASAIFYDMEQVSDADLRHMEIITFPMALVILLLIFGTLVGAFMPVSMGPLTVTAALAVIFFLG